MNRMLRLFWICLLTLALPVKAWAVLGSAHCVTDARVSAVHSQPHHGSAPVVPASDSVHDEDCAHHAVVPAEQSATTHDHQAMADHQDGEADGHSMNHSCSVCAHCSPSSALTHVWSLPGTSTLPHSAPVNTATPWRSAVLRQLDRPPTCCAV